MKIEYVGGPLCGAIETRDFADPQINAAGGVYDRCDRPFTGEPDRTVTAAGARRYYWRAYGRDGSPH